MLLLIYMYLWAPWKIGYNQMGHPHKIKKLLIYFWQTQNAVLQSVAQTVLINYVYKTIRLGTERTK